MWKAKQGFISLYAMLLLLVCVALLQVLVQRAMVLKKTSQIKEGASLYALRVVKAYVQGKQQAEEATPEEEKQEGEETKDTSQEDGKEAESQRSPTSWTLHYHQIPLAFQASQGVVMVQFPDPKGYCMLVSYDETHKSIMNLAYEEGKCPH